MGNAFVYSARTERALGGFGQGHLKERDYLEEGRLAGRIILIKIFKKWNGGRELY
jgi:hypothetical protein